MYNKTFNRGKKNRRSKKAKSTDGRQNQRIAKLENLLLPSLEFKSRDVTTSNAAISTSAYANYPMLQLEQGHGHSQRVGDKITLRSMNCKLALKKGDGTNVVRVILAATPSSTHLTLSDVLEYNNYTTHADMVFCSPYKRRAATAEKTYKIMFDKVYNLTEDVNTIVDSFKLDGIPKRGKQVEFQAIGSQQPDNFNVSLMAISDSTTSAHPQLSVIVRSKYIDL